MPSGSKPSTLSIEQTAPVALATPESLEIMPLRRVDWHRVGRDVARLKDRLAHPLADANTWAATFFGMAGAAGLGIIPVATATTAPDGWVFPAFGFACGSTLLMGILCVVFGRDAKRLRDQDITHICEEMDEIESHHPSLTASDADATPPA